MNLHKALSQFLTHPDSNVRSFILRYLNAHFSLIATSLEQKTLDSILDPDTKPRFSLFIDTNFLFSVLELHDNPSNEAALVLLEIVGQLSDVIDVQFHIMPITMEEATNAISTARETIDYLQTPKNLVNAVVDAEALSGLTRGYFERKQKTESLTPDAFFAPYVDSLASILKGRGFIVHEEDISPNATDYEIQDDIEHQLQFEKARYDNRAKSREQLEHDIALWHFISQRRPVHIESPVDAECWIVTVDYRLINFDRYKRRTHQIPICVHPSSLIQLMQFWISRTTKFEDSLLASMRMPFLFREFDADAERVTISILKALSRFENLDDLPDDIIGSILKNEALREKLKDEQDTDRQVGLIREELILVARDSRKSLAQKEKELQILGDETDKQKRLLDELKKFNVEQGEKVTQLQTKLEEQQARSVNLETERKDLLDRIQALESGAVRRKRIARTVLLFVGWILFPTVAFSLAGYYSSVVLTRTINLGPIGTTITIVGLLLLGWTIFLEFMRKRSEALRNWGLLDTIMHYRRIILAAVILGIIESLASDWFKTLTSGLRPN